MNVLFFGLGRIGLPQSLVFAEAGHQVFGYDADPAVVDNLLAGTAPFDEPGMEQLLADHVGKRFQPVKDWTAILPQVDAVLFTLGTKAPDAQTCLAESEGDISPIEEILSKLLTHPSVKKGILLVFRTTLFLGSTDRLKAFVETRLGLTEGKDFFMSFVPERLIEGQAIGEEQKLPKILSAFSAAGVERVSQLFKPVGGRQIIVSSPRTAEFCKLTDNSYRNTMFAFANELAMWSATHGVDANEVISAINTDYDRNNVPRPGFVSGYCLGKDPYIFEYGFNSNGARRDFQSLWYYGRRANDSLVDYTVERVIAGLKKAGKTPAEAKVAILGLSFKEDVDDFRMSHSFNLIDALAAAGVHSVVGFDPLLEKNKYTRIPPQYSHNGYDWTDTLDPATLSDVDAVVIAHRHKVLRDQDRASLTDLLAEAPRPLFVFDAWNVWRAAKDVEGVHYEALGFAPPEAAR
jgi:UDP-N-acetyl-D-mannosaminuronic acid dehydrogenase